MPIDSILPKILHDMIIRRVVERNECHLCVVVWISVILLEHRWKRCVPSSHLTNRNSDCTLSILKNQVNSDLFISTHPIDSYWYDAELSLLLNRRSIALTYDEYGRSL